MEAELTNPALADLTFLVGRWDMTISNASFLEDPTQSVTGGVEITPIEAGMLLAMRQVVDPAGPPLASWVIGRDGSRPTYVVLYTDGRAVSRVYEMSVDGDRWAIWRDDPDFSQRFEAIISDPRSIDGRWEKRVSAGQWEHDFNVAYARR